MSSNNNITVKLNCVFCGKLQEVSVDAKGYDAWRRGTVIQRALPKAHPFDRDALVTRMCYSCQSKTYNRPAPGEDWGPVLMFCKCCGANLYERNKNEDDALICPCCYCNQSED